MRNATPIRRKAIAIRWFTAIAVSAVLSGCAMHQGDRKMQGDAMHDSPMHQMMTEMGCAHDASDMQAMGTMSKDEKHAHMKAHMQACKSKMRQQAVDEAMTRIEACVAERMSGHSHKRLGAKKMQAMIMAEIRSCARQSQTPEAAPTASDTHEGH